MNYIQHIVSRTIFATYAAISSLKKWNKRRRNQAKIKVKPLEHDNLVLKIRECVFIETTFLKVDIKRNRPLIFLLIYVIMFC